jgi:hypothetical protein
MEKYFLKIINAYSGYPTIVNMQHIVKITQAGAKQVVYLTDGSSLETNEDIISKLRDMQV